MAPLLFAGLTKFGEVIGRILICQVAFTRNPASIKPVGSSTNDFARNQCGPYSGGINHSQWGLLIWEVVFLVVLAQDLVRSMLRSRTAVFKPLSRYKNRLEQGSKDGGV
jgi:hypothetical protein